MHFGMTGWMHIRGDKTAYTNYYKKMKDTELAEWPPKFTKFHFSTKDNPPVEVAFTDARRFGRVRLVDCPGAEIRQHSPLVENGPDPVVDQDKFTEEYLRTKMQARHVPIKALLLDQTMMSGVGNWVADETLYQAKVHPEQYCDTFSDDEIKTIWENVRYVCQTAVDNLGDSDQFPEHWLFNYRWGKGDKGATTTLPNGQKLAFITVGGRTSCYVPEVQKKTGKVPANVKTEVLGADEDTKSSKPGQKKKVSASGENVTEPPNKKRRIGKRDGDVSSTRIKREESQEPKKSRSKIGGATKSTEESVTDGRRRSGRLRK